MIGDEDNRPVLKRTGYQDERKSSMIVGFGHCKIGEERAGIGRSVSSLFLSVNGRVRGFAAGGPGLCPKETIK
jgi:hypothetical protein